MLLITQIDATEALLGQIALVAPGLEIVAEPTPSAESLARAEIVAGHLEPEELAQAARLRWNHLWTAGADADLHPELAAGGITLTSSAGNGAIPLAEHAMLLMLMLDRDVPRWQRAQQQAQWDRYPHGELAGATVAIVGMGNVGRELARRCAAFDMRVVGIRQRPDRSVPSVDEMFGPDLLIEVAARCDYLVVACPLTERTRGLVDARVLAAMAPHARVVNVSRGEVIDHDALLAALDNHQIGGAGLDAHHDEPLDPAAPWWTMPNVIVTPHNGATTPATRTRAEAIFIENLSRYQSGRELRNVVPVEKKSPSC